MRCAGLRWWWTYLFLWYLAVLVKSLLVRTLLPGMDLDWVRQDPDPRFWRWIQIPPRSTGSKRIRSGPKTIVSSGSRILNGSKGLSVIFSKKKYPLFSLPYVFYSPTFCMKSKVALIKPLNTENPLHSFREEKVYKLCITTKIHFF